MNQAGRNVAATWNVTVYSTAPNAVRFREARERLGLSPDEAAARMGISTPSLWDIECSDELTLYSPSEIRQFCQVLGISPQELFGVEATTAITASDLVALIREHCYSRGIAIQQFEDASGWHVAKCLENPERFLHDDYSIDGIQDVCRELGVDWQKFILSL